MQSLTGVTTGRLVLPVQTLEYLLLSLLLAAVELAIGCATGWLFVTRAFQLPWPADWRVIAATLVTSCVVTFGAGLLGSLTVLRTRPLAALRTE